MNAMIERLRTIWRTARATRSHKKAERESRIPWADAIEKYGMYLPVTGHDRKTGEVEEYHTFFELWSDYEWDDSNDYPNILFTEVNGREIEFKTYQGDFEYMRFKS